MVETNLTFVRELLKKYGTFIYTGNNQDDLALMEIELEDLYEWKLITGEEFLKAKTLIKRETNETHR